MLKRYLKIARRNLWKHKFYTSINVFGLALSIACSVVLFQFISYHLSFDTYHTNAPNIYRAVHSITFDDGIPLYDTGAPLALARDLKATEPAVKQTGVLLQLPKADIIVNPAGATQRKLFSEHENIGIAGADFFQLFNYTWEQGDWHTALSKPNTVVLSNKLAQKYFSSLDVLGRTISINKINFTVSGVVADRPDNTDIKADLFLSIASLNSIYPDNANDLKTKWGFINSTTSVYLLLQDGTNLQAIEQRIAKLKDRGMPPDIAKAYHFMLLPLKEMHFDGRFAGVMQRSMLTTLALVGLLLMVIACVNFINMATAQNFKRAREIGTRKVLGSSPVGIFMQFMAETGYIVFFAALLSFAMVAVMVPVLNSWLQIQLNFNVFTNYRLAGFLVLLLTMVVLAAGVYPAIILSRFKPVTALKNQVSGEIKTNGFVRKGLLIVQNVIAQVLIICTLLITLQVQYLKTRDLGFNKDAIVLLPLPDNSKSKTDYIRNQLLGNATIQQVSFCRQAPSSDEDNGGSIKFDTRDWEKFAGRSVVGDASYIKTFGLKLLAGRNIAESDTAAEYLINEVLLHKLGFQSSQEILGRRFTAGDVANHPGTIVGVVKDFHARSLYTAIEPEYITTSRTAYTYAGVKINPANAVNAVEHMKQVWQSVYPDSVFEYHFLDQQIAEFYQKEDLLNKLITTSASVAILISCMGLLGLISLMTLQRTKEIGIRKVLGASVAHITGLLSVDFLKLVLIAVFVATPIAWLAMSKYLQSFAYRIDIQWWVFALTAIGALAIAFVTVSFQSVKAAMVNPVVSLKSGE